MPSPLRVASLLMSCNISFFPTKSIIRLINIKGILYGDLLVRRGKCIWLGRTPCNYPKRKEAFLCNKDPSRMTPCCASLLGGYTSNPTTFRLRYSTQNMVILTPKQNAVFPKPRKLSNLDRLSAKNPSIGCS